MERETDAKTILIVEDNVGLNVLLTEKVMEWGYQTVSVHSGMEALSWLSIHTPYLMILDYSLPDMNGHELLANMQSTSKTIPPFIVSTGQGDESIAVEMMKLGAMDYLVKNMYFLNKLPEVLKRIDKEIENENKRKWAEIELKNSEQKYREMADFLPVGLFETDLNGTITFVNQTAINWLGNTADDFKNDVNLSNFVVDENREKAINRSQMVMTKKIELSGEYTLKRKSGGTFPVIVSSVPIIKNKKVHGLRGTIVDITERKQAEIKLNIEQKRISTILATVADPIFVKDNDHRIVLANHAFCGIFGLDESEIIGKTLADNVPLQERQHFLKVDRMVLDTGIPDQREETITTNNITRYIITKKTRFIDESGNKLLVGSIHDITERKKDEETLYNERLLLRTLIDNIPDAIYLKDLETRKTITNLADAQNIGVKSVAEVLGKTDFELFPKEVAEKFYADDQYVIQTGNSILNKEEFLVDGNGQKRWLLSSKLPLRNQTGQIIGLLGIGRNITEHKLAEEALIKSEKSNKEMIANISDVIAIIGVDGIIKYKSPNIEKWFGWLPEELIGTDAWETVHPDDLEQIQKEFYTILETKNAAKTVEYRYKCKNGNHKMIELTAVNLVHDPYINGILANYKDITERKKNEEALRENEQQLKNLFENAADAIFIADINSAIIIDANRAAEQLLKKPLHEIIGLHQSQLHPANTEVYSKNTFQKQKNELIQSNTMIAIENAVVCSDGSLVPVEVLASRVFYKGKDCQMGTFRNITDRKRSEHLIREHAEQMDVLLSTTSDGFFKLNNKGVIIEASDKMAQLIGYTTDELSNLSLSSFEAKENSKEIIEHMKNIMEHGYGIFETKYFTKSREKIDIEIRTSYWHDKDQFLVFVRDISGRKQNECELIETKTRLQKAQKIAHIGNWELNLATHKIWASDEAFNIYGIENFDQYLPLELVQTRPLTEYRPILDNALHMLITKNQPYDLEFQITRYDNQEIRSIRSLAELILDEKGKPDRVIGVIQDITEQKKLENELRKLSNAIEQNPASIVITNTQGAIEYVNPKFTQLTGYSIDEVIGKNPRVLKTGITTPDEYSNLWATISSGKIWQGEFCNKKKDGTQYWETALISPVFDTFGKIAHYVAVKEDITEKKETDRKIMSAVIEGEERERNRFSRELHDGLGPLLSSIKLYFQWISKIEDPEKKKFLSGKGNHNIDEAIITLREISNNLSPQSLNTFGLVLAIQNYVEGLNQLNDIHIDLQSNIENRFNTTIEIALYRIIMELINNCLKHAEAKNINISLNLLEFAQLIRITYKDNGKGFDIESLSGKTKGRGILNIQYRVNSLNGRIKMISSPGNGLEVTMEVPFVIEK